MGRVPTPTKVPGDEGGRYFYLPKLLMHEFPHTLGLPDTHNANYVDNPEDYKGFVMHYNPRTDRDVDPAESPTEVIKEGDIGVLRRVNEDD